MDRLQAAEDKVKFDEKVLGLQREEIERLKKIVDPIAEENAELQQEVTTLLY